MRTLATCAQLYRSLKANDFLITDSMATVEPSYFPVLNLRLSARDHDVKSACALSDVLAGRPARARARQKHQPWGRERDSRPRNHDTARLHDRGWSRFSLRHIILPVKAEAGWCVRDAHMYTLLTSTLRIRPCLCGYEHYDMRPTRVKCGDEVCVSIRVGLG